MAHRISYCALTSETSDLLTGSDVFDFPIKPDQLAAFLDDPGHVMELAVCDGVLVGMASATVLCHPDKSPSLFVNEVSVHADFRRQGIGTALMQRLVSGADSLGCRSVWLATEADNTAARGLYKAFHGNEQTGVVVYHWGDDAEHFPQT